MRWEQFCYTWTVLGEHLLGHPKHRAWLDEYPLVTDPQTLIGQWRLMYAAGHCPCTAGERTERIWDQRLGHPIGQTSFIRAHGDMIGCRVVTHYSDGRPMPKTYDGSPHIWQTEPWRVLTRRDR